MIHLTFNLSHKIHSKPSPNEVATISNALVNEVAITLNQIKNGIDKGYAFCPATFTGSRKNDNFKSQQIFALDFDSGITPTEVLERLELYSIEANIVYPSFSDTPDKRKFRVIIALDTVVTDRLTRDSIQIGLMNMFPECDKSCKDSARLFYPTNKGILFFRETLNSLSQVLEVTNSFIPTTLPSYTTKVDIDTDTTEAFNLIRNYFKKHNIEWKDGNKHHYIVKYASMCNKFGVDIEDCMKQLIKEGTIQGYWAEQVEDIYQRYANQFKTWYIEKKVQAKDTITQFRTGII